MALSFINLLVLQLIAHFLCDFIILNETNAQAKDRYGFASKHLYIHNLFVLSISWILSLNFSFWWGALVIGITHFLIDGYKARLIRKLKQGTWIFFLDQFIHILIIFVVCGIYINNTQNFTKFLEVLKSLFQSTSVLLYALGYLLCLKPSNIIIKNFVSQWLTDQDKRDSNVIKVGGMIGNIERILVLTLIFVGEFEAIGFLLAAKSILRFKEAEADRKSEYVLVGTLSSFGTAIMIGIIINSVLKT